MDAAKTTGTGLAQPLRYEALDSLRGVCACMVVLFHFGARGMIVNLPFIRQGWLFVDFFFVLSGFVIAASYGGRLAQGFPFGRFMLLRAGRLYPLHIAVLAIFLAMELVGILLPGLTPRAPFTGSRTLPDLVVSIFLLQAFNPPGGLAWNNPSWSIAAEFWTYILAALVFARGQRAAPWIVGAIIALAGAWLGSTPQHLAHDANFGVVRCFYGFFIGVVAFWQAPRVRTMMAGWSRNAASLAEGALGLLALWLVAVSGNGLATLLAPPVFALVVLVFAAERGLFSIFLLTRPMRLLGLLSYSIYMVHVFVQGRLLDVLKIAGGKLGFVWVESLPSGFKMVIAPPFVSDVLTVIMLGLVVAVAALSYALVEKPAREWSRRTAARWWSNPGPAELRANS